jgi:hypothetical protein
LKLRRFFPLLNYFAIFFMDQLSIEFPKLVEHGFLFGTGEIFLYWIEIMLVFLDDVNRVKLYQGL